MNGRKWTALVLALLMLASMLGAHAATSEGRGPDDGTYTEHTHSWKERRRVDATCTQSGTIYYTCSCQQSKTESIPALGHSWSGWSQTKAPTCVSAGEEKRTCSRCGASETRSIAATGKHSWSGWSQIKAPTCTAAGEEQRKCSVCGKTESRSIAMTEHKWGKWKTKRESTCDKAGEEQRKCSTCGKTEKRKKKKKAHTFGDWTVTLEPTCSAKGEQVRVCEKCGYEDKQAIDMLPHTYGDWTQTLAPTCTALGQETAACQVCGHEETRPVDMIPHSFGDWVVLTPATCTAEGEKARTCQVCGLEEKETIPMLDHEFGDWVIISPLTDFSIGIKERNCVNCGYLEHVETKPAGIVKKGDKGEGVKDLQEILNDAGYDCGKADGIFGKKTEAAVKHFEKDNDKPEDGVGWPGIVPKILLGGKELPEDLALTVNLTSTQAWYPENATATFEGELENISGLDLENWTLYQMSENDVGIGVWTGVAGGDFLAAGDTVTIPDLSYTVGSTDVEVGCLEVSFYVSAKAAGGKTLYSNEVKLGLETKEPGPSILLIADKAIVTDFVANAPVIAPLTLINTCDKPLKIQDILSIAYDSDTFSSEDWMTGYLEPFTEYHFTLNTILYPWQTDDKYVTRSVEVKAVDPESGMSAIDLAHVFIVPLVTGPSVMLTTDDITGMGGDVGEEVWLPLYAVNNGTEDMYVSQIESGYADEYADYDTAYDTLFPTGASFPLSYRVVVKPSDAHYCAATNDCYFWRTIFLRAFPISGVGSAVDSEDEMLWFSGPMPGLKLFMTQTTPAQETWSPDGSGHIADIDYNCVVTNSGERPVILDGLYCHMYPSTEAAYEILDLGDSITLEPEGTYSFKATLPIGTANITPGSASEIIDGLVEADFSIIGLEPESKQQIASSPSADNAFTYKVKLDAYSWTPPTENEEEASPAALEPDTSMYVYKKVTSRAKIQTKPTESGDFYQEGEEVTYEINMVNWASETLYDIEVIDRIGGVETVVDTIPSLAPNGEHKSIYHYYVKFSDASMYRIENHAWATYRVGDSPDRVKSYEDTATINVLNLPVSDGEPSTDLVVNKKHYGNPSAANGNFAEDDFVVYHIEVTNKSDHTISNIVVTDPLSGLSQIGPTFSLEPNETISVSFDYYVTAKDVENGTVKNVARASWTEDGANKYAESNLHTIFTEAPAVDIVKYVANASLLPGGFQVDEVIHYEITITNTSEDGVGPLAVEDPMAPGDGVAGTIADLPPHTSATVGFDYTVTGADVIAGEIVNQASVVLNHKNSSLMYEQQIVSNKLHTPTMSDPAISITVEDTSGKGGTLHDSIPLKVTIENTGHAELNNVWLEADSADGALGTTDSWTIPASAATSFPAGDSFDAGYVIDVNGDDENYALVIDGGGKFNRWLTVHGTDVDTGQEVTAQVKFDLNYIEPEMPVVYGGLSVVKTVENLPARGFFLESEDILFRVEVTNTSGQDVHDITMYEPMVSGGVLAIIPSLADGASSGPMEFLYTVTDLDVQTLTEINNVANVNAEGADGTKYIALSNPAIAPIGIEPFGVIVDCSVTKTETTTPANGSYYVEGEAIGYDITVTNSGEMPLTGFAAYDTLKSDGELGSGSGFAPSDSFTYHFDYVVDDWDCYLGKVINEAYVTYWLDDGIPAIAWSDPVESPTGETPPEPPTPGGPGGGMKSTGGDEPGETPDAPTSEPGETGPDYCRRTLTGVGGNERDYAIDYCGEHRAVWSGIDAMLKQGGEDDAGVWDQAVRLWTDAVNAEYRQLVAQAKPEDIPTVMSDQALFYLQLNCRRDAVRMLYPDDPVRATKAAADMLMNRCVDLCYALHTAPQSRIDSLLTGTYAALEGAEAGGNCVRDKEKTPTGEKYAEFSCADHAAADESVKRMMAGSTDAARDWQTAKRLWLSKLDVLTNARYRAADEAGKKVIAAERVCFGDWLNAREALLNLRYPDRPEIVAEVITDAIRERVFDLCGD